MEHSLQGSRYKITKHVLVAFIILYPIVRAFFGLDLGDTGYHLFGYQNIWSQPELINPTVFLSIAIGSLWEMAFGWMGLIGFNLLEVVLELSLAYLVYRTLKDVVSEIPLLIGLAIAILGMGTYLNIINYHQINVWFVSVMMILQIHAIIKDRPLYSAFAGVIYALTIFARVASVVVLVTVFMYFYSAIMYQRPWKSVGRHALAFAGGTLLIGAIGIIFLVATGHLKLFISNLGRLKNVASENTGGYGAERLIGKFIFDNLQAIASGLIFLGGTFIAFVAANMTLKKYESKAERVLQILVAVVFAAIALYQMWYSYSVIEPEPWPQMTSGPRFFAGVFYVFAFLAYLRYGLKKRKENEKITLVILASLFLMLLSIAGSNTGTKHTVMSYWFIAPVFVEMLYEMFFDEKVRSRVIGFGEKIDFKVHGKSFLITFLVFVLMFGGKFFHMIYYTFNYDSVKRTELRYVVDHPKLRGILTTEREAGAIQGVLNTLETVPERRPLAVYGASLLFYYLSDRDTFTRPWITQPSVPSKVLEKDFLKAEEKYKGNLPVIIYCRTHYSWGFAEEDLKIRQFEIRNSSDNGKKEVFLDFLDRNNYRIYYANDYYAILTPGLPGYMNDVRLLLTGK